MMLSRQTIRFWRPYYRYLFFMFVFLAGLANLSVARGTADEPLFSTMDTDAIVTRLLGWPGPSEYEPPDANKDGKIDIADAVMTVVRNPREDATQYVPRINLLVSQVDPQIAKVALAWEVHGIENPADYAVFLLAHTPSVVTTGTLAVQPGVAPATGAMFYLQPGTDMGLDHDIWGMAAQPYALDGATSRGQATALLYADMPGEWAFEAQLVPTTTTLSGWRTYGDVLAADIKSLLLTDVPAMRLSVSRSIAGTGDQVTADLRTISGAEQRSVRLYGWLALPDGSELTLPSFEPALDPLFVGTIEDETHRLMRRSLGEFGQGRFVVHAAMYDEATSRLLSLAQAPVLVSDALSTITGRVLATVGEDTFPIVGPSFEMARVRALGADDLATVDADIDSSGTYRLSLPPGRYLLSAITQDGWTNHEEALAAPLVLEGRADLVHDFTLDSLTTTTGSVAALTPLKRLSATPRPMQALSSPVTKPRLFVMIQRDYATGASPQGDAMVQRQLDRMRQRMPGVEIVTSDDVRELLRRAAELEQNNRPNLHLIEEIASAQATRSMMNVKVVDRGAGSAGGDFFFHPKLFDISNVSVTYRGPISWTDDPNEIIDDIDQATARDAPGLEQEIIRRNPVPDKPKVRLELSSYEVYGGTSVDARVTLLDEANGQPVNGKIVTIIHRKGPDYRTILDTLTGTTGSSGPGEFTVRLQAPADAEFCAVDAVFERNGQSWPARSKLYSVLQVNSGTGLKFDSHSGGLAANWQAGTLGKVTFRVEDAFGNPINGVRVNTSGVNCRVEDDQPITGALGIAWFDFYAGNRNGHAAVHAACVLPGDPMTIHRAVFKFQVLAAPRIEISRSQPQSLRAQSANKVHRLASSPDVEGVVPLYVMVYKGDDLIPAAPVNLYVNGSGSLLGAQSQTNLYGVSHVTYLPPDLQSGTAEVTAVATVGDEVTSAVLDVDYDPGLVMEAWVPDFLDANGDGTLEVRVGRAQATGDPIWEEGVNIDISALGGTAGTPTGQTDASGRFTTTLHLADGSQRIDLIVQAVAQDHRIASRSVAATKTGKRRIEVYVVENWSFGYDAGSNHPPWRNAIDGTIFGSVAGPYSSAYTQAGFGRVRSVCRSAMTASNRPIYSDTPSHARDDDAHAIGIVNVRDQIVINHPRRTGERGTGRLHWRRSADAGMTYSFHEPAIYGSGALAIANGNIYSPQQIGIDNYDGGIYLEYHYRIEGPRSIFERYLFPQWTPITFIYGEPFELFCSLDCSAGVATENGHNPPFTASSYGYYDAIMRILPDDIEATVSSESGHGY